MWPYRLVRKLTDRIPFSRWSPPRTIRLSLPINSWTTEGHVTLITSLPPEAQLTLAITALPMAHHPAYAARLREPLARIEAHFDTPPVILRNSFLTSISLIEWSPERAADSFPFLARLEPEDREGSEFLFRKVRNNAKAGSLHRMHHNLLFVHQDTRPMNDAPGETPAVVLTVEAEIGKRLPSDRAAELAYLRPILTSLLGPPNPYLQLPDASQDFTGLVAYASNPEWIGETILKALPENTNPLLEGLMPWQRLQGGDDGLFAAIERKILGTNVLVADLTVINENVLYELALATGARKRVIRIHDETRPRPNHLHFDRDLRLRPYKTATELDALLVQAAHRLPEPIPASVYDFNAEPELLGLLPGDGTDYQLVEQLLEHSAFRVTSFPKPSNELQFHDTFRVVAAKAGVIVALLPFVEANLSHNYAAIAIAAFARGLGRSTLLMMCGEGGEWVPFDLHTQISVRYVQGKLADHTAQITAYATESAVRLQTRFKASLPAHQSLAGLTLETAAAALPPFRAERETDDQIEHRFDPPSWYASLYDYPVQVIIGTKGVGKSCLLRYEQIIRKQDPATLVVVPSFSATTIGRLQKLHTQKVVGLPMEAQLDFWRIFWRMQLSTLVMMAIKEHHQGAKLRHSGRLPTKLTDQIKSHCDQLYDASDLAAKIKAITSSRITEFDADIHTQLAERQADIFIYIDNIDKDWFIGSGGDHAVIIQGLLSALEALADLVHDSTSTYHAVVAVHDEDEIDRVEDAYVKLKRPEQVITLEPTQAHLARILVRRFYYDKNIDLPPGVPFRHIWWHLAASHLDDGSDSWDHAVQHKAGLNVTKLLAYLASCISRTDNRQPIPVRVLLETVAPT